MENKISNKETIRKFMDDLWNKKKIEVVDQIFAKEAVIHSPLGEFRYEDNYKIVFSKWIEAIPDIRVEQIHLVEDGDVVVSHWQAFGVHRTALNSMKATGEGVNYSGVTCYRMREGKIIEYWAYLDNFLK